MAKADITLVFPNSPFLIDQAVFPPLGILYLSSFLKDRGYKVECVDQGIAKYFYTDIKNWANIVGISFTSPQRHQAYSLSKALRRLGKITIAGGPHPTHMPNECLDVGKFDYVVVGSGEERLLDLMETMIGDPFETYLPPSDIKIDQYPFPDRDALPIKDYKYYIDGELATVLMTSRGCPFRCSFCAKIDDNFRLQSANRTLMEIYHLRDRYEYKAFMIFDDCFTASKSRLETIAKDLTGKNMKFRSFSRSNLINDHVCQCLRAMGMVEVGIGVESGSAQILKRNMKNTTPQMNLKAVKMLQSYGIRAKTFLIVGLPGETHETIKETMKWIEEAQPDDLDVSIFQPLPGSDIFANPNNWDISFKYNGVEGWYKGKPGEYETTVSTEGLESDELLEYRDLLEDKYKRKELLR